ncbi:EamA-like transporter family protein [Acinetobacter calcoaceticus]|uniref:EamA-like transporter family protein n=1 Tax=Acinetobacter calcoaceticus TaxID=471 RepID=A0A4R1Y4S1_ACICA|nr:EamA-like transporter family protein [Acinetobacter calcoaceticus]
MLIKIALAMLAFAANSILCRLALVGGHIDPYSFSILRVSSAAITLYFIFIMTQPKQKIEWHCKSAVYLSLYILPFSIAYIQLGTGVGALLLFGTVQISMTLYGLYTGEQINFKRGIGILLACIGMLILLLPCAQTPSFVHAILMVIAGISWAAYSISGQSSQNPISRSLGNFVFAVPMILAMSIFMLPELHLNWKGIILALISGSLTSSFAYTLWYVLVKQLDSISASTVQLSVPCIAIFGGAVLLDEWITMRMLLSTTIVLCGILLVIFANQKKHLNP